MINYDSSLLGAIADEQAVGQRQQQLRDSLLVAWVLQVATHRFGIFEDEHRADGEGVVDLRPITRQRQLDGPLQVLIDAKTETYCLGARSTMC